jgi:alpha-tubulin suppressor-like RCC1 family protein/Flp pilus assembly pilin Flp
VAQQSDQPLPDRKRKGPPQRGQGMLEYVIIIAAIALLVIAVLSIVGQRTSGVLCGVGGALVGGTAIEGWGDDSYGEMGDGNTNASTYDTSPQSVTSRCDFSQVAAGDWFFLGLTPDGTVWAWGMNSSGQLGNGTTTGPSLCGGTACGPKPTQVLAGECATAGECGASATVLNGVVAIGAGVNYSFAVRSDGTVWSWGYNGGASAGYGNLGVGQNGSGLPMFGLPMEVVKPGCTQTAAQAESTSPACAGLGTNGSGTNPIVRASAGTTTGFAVDNQGLVWAWGEDNSGELGNDGSTTSTNNPVQSGAGVLPRIKSIISQTGHHSEVLDVNGNVWTWGDNENGESGTYTCAGGSPPSCTAVSCVFGNPAPAGTYLSTPAEVQNTADTGPLTGIAAIVEGAYSDYAVTATGTLYAWGCGQNGQIGNGLTTVNNTLPIGVATTVYSVAARSQQVSIVDTSGRPWGWGLNTTGAVGNGSVGGNVLTPTLVVGGITDARSTVSGGNMTIVSTTLPLIS